MRGAKVRKLAVLVAIGAAVAALVKKLRGEPAPQFANHPTVRGGPASGTVRQATFAARPAPTDPTVPTPADAGPGLIAAPTDPTVAESTPRPDAASEPEAEAEPEPEPEPEPAVDPTWVEPVDGACPDGYPVKAKVSSGIFHQPGGLAYDRTKPDRCYPDATSAEADGLRAAKR